jgi:colanic acid biosynthesis glycosyl transferase WcaI
MRVLIVSQGFNPEPHFKGLSFARELQRQGAQVQVLTGLPNYPGGQIYPGYRVRFIQKEIMEGVEVIRVPLYPSHDSSPIRRAATYLSFALAAAFIGVWFVRPADVVYIYHPPASTGFAGLIMRLFRAKRAVYDIQDLWPDTLRATGMMESRWLLGLVSLWCRFTYLWIDKAVVLSQGFKKRLIERGVPASKIEVIHNWADEAAERPYSFQPKLAQQYGFEGRFNVLFAGQMGKAQALSSVLKAAEILQRRAPEIQCVFIGGGTEKSDLEDQTKGLGLKNVRFLPPVPITDIGNWLALADVLLVHLKRDPLFEITIPSKTQGYLASGKPILMAVEGEAAEIVEAAKAGIRCEPDNAAAIAEACLQLYRLPKAERDAMGANGLQYYREHLSLQKGVASFMELFHSLSPAEARLAPAKI